MITREDTIALLGELEDSGVDIGKMMDVALKNSEANVGVIKFINSKRPFEANKFYEKIRKSYNNKKSTLYINIVNENLIDKDKVLTTLASLNLQILLFSKNVENQEMFLRHMRFQEICEALLKYSKDSDLLPCIMLLEKVKADIKAFQYFSKPSHEENN